MEMPQHIRSAQLPAITEFHSFAWRQVVEYATARIALLREKNDTPGMTEAQTEGIRGQIVALKDLLAQADAPRDVPDRDIYHNHQGK